MSEKADARPEDRDKMGMATALPSGKVRRRRRSSSLRSSVRRDRPSRTTLVARRIESWCDAACSRASARSTSRGGSGALLSASRIVTRRGRGEKNAHSDGEPCGPPAPAGSATCHASPAASPSMAHAASSSAEERTAIAGMAAAGVEEAEEGVFHRATAGVEFLVKSSPRSNTGRKRC